MGLTFRLGQVPLAIFTDSSNNVGIGGSPSGTYKLEVTGEGRFYQSATSTTAYLRVENNRTRNAAVYTATTNGGFYAGTSIGTDTFNYQIYDGVAGAARLTIASTGAATFSRNDAGNISVTVANAYINQGNLINFQQNNAGSTLNAYIGHGGDSTGNFVIMNNGITPLTLAKATGAATFSSSVGIGGSPSDTIGYGIALDVQSSSGGALYLRDSSNPTTQYGFIAYDGNDDGLKIQNQNSSGYIRLNTNGSERMRITSGGDLWLGNDSNPYFEIANGGSTNVLSGIRWVIGSGRVNYGGVEMAASSNNNGYMVFNTRNAGSTSERMRITSGGTLQQTIPNSNDGLFHQIPANSYTGYIYSYVVNNGGSYYLGLERVSGSGLCNGALTYSTVLTTNNSTTLTLGTNGTARVMITAAGFLKAKGDESGYYNASGAHHELRSGTGGEWNTIMSCTAANPYGLLIGLTPGISNTGNEFISAYVGNFSTLRFKVASNGGVYNYTGNNVPLSDQRMKKEITPLESYWNKFKEIEMVKFKYIDQTHDDFNIGVVSQQIESIMPEFVDVWDERNIPEDGKPLMGVYMEDIHNIAMKVLQEAMIKIEELEAKVTALENR